MSVCDCRRCGAEKAGDSSTGLCESCEDDIRIIDREKEKRKKDPNYYTDFSDYD